jgi:hypothetical protein
MRQFNKYSAGVVAERKAEEKYLLGANSSSRFKAVATPSA